MKKYDWKNEYNPIRRTAKRLLSGEALTDGRPLSDLIELDEHTRKCLAFEATLTDRQIDMLQELGYHHKIRLPLRQKHGRVSGIYTLAESARHWDFL